MYFLGFTSEVTKMVHEVGGQKQKKAYISLQNVAKVYGAGRTKVDALQGVCFEIGKGELCVILGSSGAGKTTLLNILGGMDQATSGHVFVDGRDVTQLKKRELIDYRRHSVGFVFQFYNLIPSMTAVENVEMAAMLGKDSMDPGEALALVELSGRVDNFPAQLSGGEQQRVAIARAIAKNPRLLLCDEPTGALDDETGKHVLKLLYEQSRKHGMTVVIITHNQAIAPIADRIVRMRSGKIESVEINASPMHVDDIRW